jgi:hypothetical protein
VESLQITPLSVVPPCTGTTGGRGQISGVVRDRETGKPATAVTVVISGPALPDDEILFTDSEGRYCLDGVPPGSGYVASFLFGTTEIRRPRVFVVPNRASQLNAAIPLAMPDEVLRGCFRPEPNINTQSAATGIRLTGRGFEPL